MRWNFALPLREELPITTGGTIVLRESSILSLTWGLSTPTIMVFGLDVVHRVNPFTPRRGWPSEGISFKFPVNLVAVKSLVGKV